MLHLSVQVIDLISLKPFDMETIAKSVKKTRKVIIVEECMKTGAWWRMACMARWACWARVACMARWACWEHVDMCACHASLNLTHIEHTCGHACALRWLLLARAPLTSLT